MQIQIPISLGELVDKLSILKIKAIMIKNEEKLKEINKESSQLQDKLNALGLLGMAELLEDLTRVNRKLWDIEDEIRVLERSNTFNDKFIQLARSVYITNDQRFDIKRRINLKFGSDLNEVKSYEKY